MSLNICLLKPYLWPAALLGQSPPAAPFLQQPAKLCPCYMCLLGEQHLPDHPHHSKPFGLPEPTSFSPRSWHLCLGCNLCRKLHFVHLILCLTSTALGSPPPSFNHLAVLVDPAPACQCRDGQAKHFKPGFLMLLCEAREVLPAFLCGIHPSCAGNVKLCKALYKQRTQPLYILVLPPLNHIPVNPFLSYVISRLSWKTKRKKKGGSFLPGIFFFKFFI